MGDGSFLKKNTAPSMSALSAHLLFTLQFTAMTLHPCLNRDFLHLSIQPFSTLFDLTSEAIYTLQTVSWTLEPDTFGSNPSFAVLDKSFHLSGLLYPLG